jgi:hypothetical protein
MLHESLKVREFIVKENEGFRLRLRSWKVISPADLNAIEFINESLNEDGEIVHSSTYNFYMTDEEIKTFAKELVNE